MSIWQKAGTIAVTNGSGVVTGTGTGWNGKVQVGDAIHMPDGRVYEVVTVTSDTVIGIAPNYLGSTATGQAYRIQPTRGVLASYLATVQAWMAGQQGFIDGPLAGRFGDGTAALPGLAFAADLDTGMRRKGNNALALVTGGGDRFEVNNAGAILTGLLTGGAVTQSATDATAGRLLKVGDFGIGGGAVDLTGTTDLKDRNLASGFYGYNANTVPGGPETVAWRHVLQVISTTIGGSVRRMFISSRAPSGTDHRVWIGVSEGTSAITWREVLHAGLILGTVSQSGGQPTGAVIERGSNGNGEYVRFADGAQICTRTADLGSILADGSGTQASPYRTSPATLSFAAWFSAAPVVSFAFPAAPEAIIADRALVTAGYQVSTGAITALRAARIGGGNSAANVTCTLTAIGRWF